MTKMNPEIHLIGNAHIDPVWIWNWREGMHEVWSTFRSALDRLREYPEVCFTASSAAYYAWIETEDPSMFAEIKKQVASGRWGIVGGMWVEPDCNLPSGESFCRHTLYSQQYFQRTFGKVAQVGYNIDSFGHNLGLPQILAKSGLHAYVMMRPEAQEKTLPGPIFRWQGPDGTEVLTFRLMDSYTSPGTDQEVLRQRLARARSAITTLQQPLMVFYGVGNHGGGPTRATLDGLQDLRKEDHDLRFSSPDIYFEALTATDAKAFPVVTDDLQHHASGAYAVMQWVKSANQHAEMALGVSEQLDAVAQRLWHTKAHSAELTMAWKHVLFNQFHDILAGTSSEPAYASIRNFYGFSETVADEVGARALDALARKIDTRAADEDERPATPILLYNPLSWPVRQVVEGDRPAEEIRDAQGNRVRSQSVPSGEGTMYATHALWVADLPPLGYRVYWAKGGRDISPPKAVPWKGERLENAQFRITVHPDSGVIESLWDKRQDRELLGAGGWHPVVLHDDSDTWSHGVFRYGTQEEPCRFVGGEWLESGPLRTTLRLRYQWGQSHITQRISLVADMPMVEIRGTVDWHEGHRVLKMRLPFNLPGKIHTHAGAAYAVIRREPTGNEEPTQLWVACETDEGLGVGCTTGDRYSYDVRDSVLRLTLLRSPRVADHGRPWVEDHTAFSFTDQGRHAFAFRLFPYQHTWAEVDMPRRALEQITEFPKIVDTCHRGPLPPMGSGLKTSGEGVIVSSVKRSEDQTGLVLRLWQSSGEETTLGLEGDLLEGRKWSYVMQPFELITVFVPDDVELNARVVDITELATLQE